MFWQGLSKGRTRGCVLRAVCVPGLCWFQDLPNFISWVLENTAGLLFLLIAVVVTSMILPLP